LTPQNKHNYKRLKIIPSIGILAAFLIVVPILGIQNFDKAYSSISSSIYDNIQNKFDNLFPYDVPELNKDENTESLSMDDSESQSVEMAAITSPTSCRNSVYDMFDRTYVLREGQTSPNGEWKNVYSGYGSTGVKAVDGRIVFYLSPMASTSAAQTLAALVKSTDKFCDFSMQVDMNTVKPLRKGSPANTWEVGWLFFRYTDTFHYYWLLVKPNGIELGKKDCDTCSDPVEGQKYLVTKSTPTLKFNTWNKVKVDMIGNNIKVYWNGNLVIDYVDRAMSPKLASGNIAMYSEDAYVLYNGMAVSYR
jgi:hypothetical protein